MEPVTEPEHDDRLLKDRLHQAFDTQIPNYGAYNLVFAAGDAGAGGSFVLGFRQQPLELVVAPVDARTHQPIDQATSVDLTNVSHLAQLHQAGYEVAVTTGRVFRFDVDAAPVLFVDDESGTRRRMVLDQGVDALEFTEFAEAFMDALDSLEPAG